MNKMTVRELIERLQQHDQDAKVRVEGCDCLGDAGGVEIDCGEVLITRTDSEIYAEDDDE